MDTSWSEASYPLTFREEEAKALGQYLNLRHNVEVIGMKRVGISNFLRFFLYHPGIVKTYISKTEKHLFIPVDCNDLIEREVFAFWMLTFKRLVDTTETSSTLSPKTKKLISDLFLSSIQSNDLFLTVENIRRAVVEITSENILPTFFFIRFDRIKSNATQEFFANLAGLSEASGQKLCYVFTNYKPLDEILSVRPTSSLSILNSLYLRPASPEDSQIIFQTLEKRYPIKHEDNIVQKIIDLAAGHVQYLQLSLIILHQKGVEDISQEKLEEQIASDERVILLSEEIWESLSDEEREIVKKVQKNRYLSSASDSQTKYLLDSGIVKKTDGKFELFNTYFSDFAKGKMQSDIPDSPIELTKKEHLLYTFLVEHLDTVCERDSIIEAVWPESEEFGVSDWTIDRLTARLRTKLKQQTSKYSIITVKTRGYKMVEEG